MSPHPLHQELLHDELMSVEQQQNAEDLDDSIARQAEQIRKERLSKRMGNERAHAKAIAALKIDSNEVGVISLEKDATHHEKDRALDLGKERERDREAPASPTSPVSMQSQLWAQSSVAGERAGVRADVISGLPVVAGPGGGGTGAGLTVLGAPGLMSSAASRDLQPGPEGSTVLVGNLIGEDHVNYVMMYNMLTGIRIGVSSYSGQMTNGTNKKTTGLEMRSQSKAPSHRR